MGVDICQVEGISEVSAIEFISEVGTDMFQWRSYKHFSAWLNLVPNTKITGGKIISSKMRRKKNHAGQTLRMAASNISTCKSPMGEHSRKMKSKLGKKGGVVASAHKLARILYTMIKEKKPYNREIIISNNDKIKEKQIRYYKKKLELLKKSI